MLRRTKIVANARRASASSYFRKRAGIFVETKSRATKRANAKPTTLAAMLPAIESAHAIGHGQMSGAAIMNATPGKPHGCSSANAATNAK
jgi:hypothetical protein